MGYLKLRIADSDDLVEVLWSADDCVVLLFGWEVANWEFILIEGRDLFFSALLNELANSDHGAGAYPAFGDHVLVDGRCSLID